jgi:hypothetical protein
VPEGNSQFLRPPHTARQLCGKALTAHSMQCLAAVDREGSALCSESTLHALLSLRFAVPPHTHTHTHTHFPRPSSVRAGGHQLPLCAERGAGGGRRNRHQPGEPGGGTGLRLSGLFRCLTGRHPFPVTVAWLVSVCLLFPRRRPSFTTHPPLCLPPPPFVGHHPLPAHPPARVLRLGAVHRAGAGGQVQDG